MSEWLEGGAMWPWFVVVPVAIALAGLLAYMIVMPLVRKGRVWDPLIATDGRKVAAEIPAMKIRRIGAALEHAPGDARILSAAVALARTERAHLFLIHVVDTPGTMLMGEQSGSQHATGDENYLDELVRELESRDLPVESMLRFGRPTEAIAEAVDEAGLDLLVMGSHGHSRMESLIYGETVAAIHHRIRVPLLVVPSYDDQPASERV